MNAISSSLHAPACMLPIGFLPRKAFFFAAFRSLTTPSLVSLESPRSPQCSCALRKACGGRAAALGPPGIMDVGVGSFVFSNALVHQPASRPSFRPCAPLLCLGGLRLLATTATGYHVDAEEYGKHWNFFLTLAAIAAVSASTTKLSMRSCCVAGCIILAGQQIFLSLGGIQLAHSAARGPALWSRNKEGLISLPGFCALSLLSRSLTMWLKSCISQAAAACRSPSDKHATSRQVLLPPAAPPLAIAAMLWLAAWQLDAWVQPVSRRACNASYILWSLALNFSMLLAFACVAAQDAMLTAGAPEGSSHRQEAEAHAQPTGRDARPLPILHALNDNMLAVFLLANVLTGACNLAIDTRACRQLASLTIIALYVATLACSSLLLPRKRHCKNWALKHRIERISR